MDYKKIYTQLIEKSRNRKEDIGYYESHHILPICMGGSDDLLNLAKLTLREHYIAHKLLTYIYPNDRSIHYAFWMMTLRTKRIFKSNSEILQKYLAINKKWKFTSKEYEFAKSAWLDIIRSNPIKRNNDQKKRIKEATIKAMKDPLRREKCRANKGTKWYTDLKTNISYKWHPGDPEIDLTKYRWGRHKISNETKEKISSTFKNSNHSKYLIEGTNFRYTSIDDNYIKELPTYFHKTGHVGNEIRSFTKYIDKALAYLNDNGIFIENDIKFNISKNKNRKYFYSIGVYEICLDLLRIGDFDIKTIANKLNDNIELIKILNDKYLKMELIHDKS